MIYSRVKSHMISFDLIQSTTVPKVVRAIEALVQQHHIFRARSPRDVEGRWFQNITRELTSSYKFEAHALSNSTDIKYISTSAGEEFDIENGPLFAVRLFDVTATSDQQSVAITIHSLIADAASVRYLVQDLQKLLSGNMISAKTTSFQNWISLFHPITKEMLQ
jgi:hypothetical protein